MTRSSRLPGAALLLLAVATAGCAQPRPEFGECRFGDALRVVELRATRLTDLRIARSTAEPDAIYIATGRSVASTRSEAEALRVDLATGADTATDVPFGAMSGRPEGERWIHFGSGGRRIRTSFRGTKTTRPSLGRVRRLPTFTGVRSVFDGGRLLLEQQLTNVDHVPGPDRNVAVDPAGDLVACLCHDGRAAWIGVFQTPKRFVENE